MYFSKTRGMYKVIGALLDVMRKDLVIPIADAAKTARVMRMRKRLPIS